MRIGRQAVCLVVSAAVFVCVAHAAPEGQEAHPTAARSESFDQSEAAGWELLGGAQVASIDGQTALTCSNGGHGYWPAVNARDLDLKFRYRAGQGVGRVAVNISGEPPNNQEYSIVLPPGEIGVDRVAGGQTQTLAAGPSPIQPGGWYDVAVRVQNGQISVAVGGQTVVTAVDRQPLPAGIVGFGALEGSGFAFDQVSFAPSGAVVETHAMQVEVRDPMVAQVESASSGQSIGAHTVAQATPIPAQQFPATTQAKPLPIRGSFDIYMKLGDIPGDSDSLKHKNWIRVKSFGFSIGSSTSNESWTRRDHGGGTSKAAFGPLMITKRFDIGSPAIYLSCAMGTSIAEAKVRVVDQQDVTRMEIRLFNLRVIGVETKTAAGFEPGEGVDETLALSFAKVDWTYFDQIAGNKTAGWDLVANSKR